MATPPGKRGLGRGLSALMADVRPDAAEPAGMPPEKTAERVLPVDQIHPNPDQPRRRFDETELQELAASIREQGVIQPLVVRPHGDGYQIVAGERRWRAAQIAQVHSVPAVIRDYDDLEVLQIAIIENVQRSDLNPIEEAAGYQQLMARFGHTQEKLAEALGKSRSHIANLTRLLTLPPEVRGLVTDGKLSAGHARTLVGLENAGELARQIVAKGLSVREAERLAAQQKPDQKRARSPSARMSKDADTLALENDLMAAIGMKVSIDHIDGTEGGSITISYRSLEQLDDICRALSGS